MNAREPLVPGWAGGRLTLNGEAFGLWEKGSLRVLSSIGDMDLPGGGVGPTWIISVSIRGKRRATDRHVKIALRDFGMIGAEEDNHEPGVARKFFLVVDPARRGICECKTDESIVVEPDGYRWSRPKKEGHDG